MGRLLSLKHVEQYSEKKTGWDVYSLFFDPIPVLAYRNVNGYDKNYIPDDWHSTFSWRKNWICKDAIKTALPILRRWKALRSSKKGVERSLRASLPDKLPRVIETFHDRVKKLKSPIIRRIRDVHPNRKYYPEVVFAMAKAVEQVGEMKSKNGDKPMLGSKALHFVLPEFFPVWDTAVIGRQCLPHETIPELPLSVSEKLEHSSPSAAEYAKYVHLMVTELASISKGQYERIEKACIKRAVGSPNTAWAQSVLDWHYDDMSTIVFEICLLGKHRRHIKVKKG